MLSEVLDINLQQDTEMPWTGVASDLPASDDQLAASVLAGDEAAFAEIFERYKRLVTHTVGRFFADRGEIEEAVQQSFTKAYFSLKHYRGGENRSFAAWLTRITVNVCYDEFRRRQRRSESSFSDLAQDDDGTEFDIADGRAESTESEIMTLELARKVLGGVSAEDRVALTLVYSQEYSLDEAASAIGISPSSLKSRLFRCRNQLRSKFGYLFK